MAIAMDALFALGDDLEQQFGTAWIDLDVAEFIKAEQVEAAVAADDPAEDAVGDGFDEFVDQLRGGDVADAAALFAGGEAESDDISEQWKDYTKAEVFEQVGSPGGAASVDKTDFGSRSSPSNHHRKSPESSRGRTTSETDQRAADVRPRRSRGSLSNAQARRSY